MVNQSFKSFKRYDLSGKTAIVTGGSSGIGHAIALDLAQYGSNIVIADVATAENTIAKIKRIGGIAVYVKADVRNRKEVEKITNFALEKFGKIDILANCAGILSRYKGTELYKFIEIAEEDWDTLMNINLKGVFLCSQTVAPHMIKQKSGKIINIGSVSSRAPILNVTMGGADYCISKAGVHALTRVLAWELAPYGINVNTVAPGPVETQMLKAIIEMVKEKYKKIIPFERIGKPQDIANLVTFLATDAASYITGQAIYVNGGMLMAN